MILDSGNRTEFETGAVRDIQEGKGRCDLMPLDVVATILDDNVIGDIYLYIDYGETVHLYEAIKDFDRNTSIHDKLLEVSKHFEEGAKKYGENNWQKGIPEERYIDSAVRHYLKWLRGDTDERHDRAFVWNIMCLIWTNEHITNKQEEK